MQLLPNGNFVLVHSKVDKQQKCNPFNVFDAICIMQKLFFVNVIDKKTYYFGFTDPSKGAIIICLHIIILMLIGRLAKFDKPQIP